jgi:tetratricopeptide (TPR) repeat protein
LNPHLPTDLGYILRKALRQEPEERYPSVEAFASDVRAFLEWRPVQARTGDAWYRTRKFLRRYRMSVTAAVLVIASLSAGLYAYMRVARVQGVPISPNLGQMDQAAKNLLIAQGFIDSVLASQPENRTALLRSAQIAHDRMILARFSGRHDDALAFARKSAEWLQKFHAGKSDKSESSAVLNTYLNVADHYRIEQQFDEALSLCRRGIELARLFDDQSYAGNFFWAMSQVFRGRGDLDEALKTAQESVRVLEPGSEMPGRGQQTMSLVMALANQGKILAQDANDQLSRNRLADAGVNLANALRHSDARRALGVYDHTLLHLAEVKNNSSFRRVRTPDPASVISVTASRAGFRSRRNSPGALQTTRPATAPSRAPYRFT